MNSLMMNISYWNNYTEDDELTGIDEYIAAFLGPKRLPLNWLLPLTTMYAIIFITGLVGNICTCIVIASNPYMQTATNCYLFNLAVADVLTLICAMPLELYSLWHQYPWQLGNWTCIMRTVMSEATAYASILTIATFSCEQYVAVCFPLRQTSKSKVTRACRNIVIIWISSFTAAAPYGFFTKVNYLTVEPEGFIILESAWCGFPFNDPNKKWETLMLCSTVLFFVIPVVLIGVLYFRICLTLHQARNLCRSETTDRSNSDWQRARIRSRRIIIGMLMTVVVAFFVCWAPYHSQRLLFLYVSLYGEWTESLRKVNQNLFSIAGCFYYFNSTINPVLYSVMSNRFRVAFREKICAGNPCTCFLCCFCCCWRWWQTRTSQMSSSCSSSMPPVNIALPTVEPFLQTRLKTVTREKLIPDTKRINKQLNFYSSGDKSTSKEDIFKRRFSSDPNFSLGLLAVSPCPDYTNSNKSEYHLARDSLSFEHKIQNGECVSCTSCNNAVPKLCNPKPIESGTESLILNGTKQSSTKDETEI